MRVCVCVCLCVCVYVCVCVFVRLHVPQAMNSLKAFVADLAVEDVTGAGNPTSSVLPIMPIKDGQTESDATSLAIVKVDGDPAGSQNKSQPLLPIVSMQSRGRGRPTTASKAAIVPRASFKETMFYIDMCLEYSPVSFVFACIEAQYALQKFACGACDVKRC